MTGLISKIQRYSTKDGPGLRSTVFMIGCNLRCRWCANPELIDPGPKILYHADRCIGCGACVAISGGAIRLGENGCVIDRESCTNLEDCAAACFYDAYESLGFEITAADLVEKLMRDKTFYDHSGGGVTFSGGEAAMQDRFVCETANLLRERGVRVALDTAGLVSLEKLKSLADNVDLVLYDMKAFDDAIHRKYTGASNVLILENARHLADMGKSMIIRLILIPGVNDQQSDLESRLKFVKSLGSTVQQVDILKFHQLGAGKYICLGLPNLMEGASDCPDHAAEDAAALARRVGLSVTVGG